MIDLILFSFFVGCVYGGFKAGNKYKTLGEAFSAAKAGIKAMLS
jgi:hypothetical protein